MKIELDKIEYENLQKTSYNNGYKEGWVEAGTFVLCKKSKDWKNGDLHMKTKSSGDYCLVCASKEEQEKQLSFIEKNIPQIREKIGGIIFKKFPSGDKQRYKASKIYSDILMYIESIK